MTIIDCDIHPALPSTKQILPWLDDHWREQVQVRGIDGLQLMSYPPGAPVNLRPDWKPDTGMPGHSIDLVRSHVLDRWGIDHAICNLIYGAPLIFGQDLSVALCRAVNDWFAATWLLADSRLKGSILLPMQDPVAAAAEIDRCAANPAFVQATVFVTGELPLGRRQYWPVYAAAERHGIPITIHAGSSCRHPATITGWPSFHIEDVTNETTAFQTQLLSLVAEGVFIHHPELMVVLAESGIAWWPSFTWRIDKLWRGLRMEIPWVNEPPGDILRRHVRVTLHPSDLPDDPAVCARLFNHIDAPQMLMFASDYPHWRFDGDDYLPAALPADLVEGVLWKNAAVTYPRLSGTASAEHREIRP